VDTALDVFQWKQDGKSISEIRDMVDEKYGSDFGEGTPTPPVE
jgi:hypothetical protein